MIPHHELERLVQDHLDGLTSDDEILVLRANERAWIDVLHRLNGVPVDIDTVLSADERDVLAVRMPVLPPQHVLTEKLNSLTEHYCDFAALLPAVRAVREHLDWDRLAEATADNLFAAAFLLLADRLGLTT